MDRLTLSFFDIVRTLSNAVDLVSPELSGHHLQVARLAFHIAQQMVLNEEAKRNVFLAGLVHDIGALSARERLSLIEAEPSDAVSHGFRGARLLKEFEPFNPIADIVRYHHLPWSFGRGRRYEDASVPIESHIIHLADRACVLLKSDGNVLGQIPALIDSVKSRTGSVFAPEPVDALAALAAREYVWLELIYSEPLDAAPKFLNELRRLSMDEVVDISRMFSHIIDFRSRFTATHSAGVAKTAEKLAEMAGFSQNECLAMRMAGYLHDLGKLAIDNALLEKPGKLTAQEFDIVRSHTYFTYRLLSGIEGFETINRWASFHHEKLNGTGYPFHLRAESLPAGSRIMAVADIFTAVTEPRPYRESMKPETVKNVLRTMAASGEICGQFVTMLLDHFRLFTDVCLQSQQEAAEHYERFFSEDADEYQKQRSARG
jgi:HD-GYP domain-containing protein (c-di-GMP phosphodiesterase class II)